MKIQTITRKEDNETIYYNKDCPQGEDACYAMTAERAYRGICEHFRFRSPFNGRRLRPWCWVDEE